MITPRLHLFEPEYFPASTYGYIMNGQAREIKCHYYLISQVFLSMTKTYYKVGTC